MNFVKNEFFRKLKNDGEMLGISPFCASASRIIVGFSGGADSSLLLSYLVYLRDTEENYPEITALHVNHMLRGDEADRDEDFCRNRCAELGVPLETVRVNVPGIMESSGLGAEECARNARYDAFRRMAEKCEGSVVATAHNADDNLETVLFNLARGGGTSGLSGIPPVRDGYVVRPLLCLSGEEIRNACESMDIPFVVDSTNVQEEYTRNFMRHSVVPLLRRVNPEVAAASVRSGMILREDEDYLRSLAVEAVGEYLPKTGISDSVEIPRAAVAKLPLPVMSRAVMMAVAAVTNVRASSEQIRLCRRLVTDVGTGKVTLPDNVVFEVARDLVIVERAAGTVREFCIPVELPEIGECLRYSCAEGGFDLYLSRDIESLPDHDENIYKLSINTAIRFDTIYGKVYARQRRDGDTLFLGGHTRRLKKMICERGIPESRRARLPVICDDDGVLAVPGLPVRGPAYARECDFAKNVLYVRYCLKWRICDETSDA